jgi:hypothetical protein
VTGELAEVAWQLLLVLGALAGVLAVLFLVGVLAVVALVHHLMGESS